MTAVLMGVPVQATARPTMREKAVRRREPAPIPDDDAHIRGRVRGNTQVARPEADGGGEGSAPCFGAMTVPLHHLRTSRVSTEGARNGPSTEAVRCGEAHWNDSLKTLSARAVSIPPVRTHRSDCSP